MWRCLKNISKYKLFSFDVVIWKINLCHYLIVLLFPPELPVLNSQMHQARSAQCLTPFSPMDYYPPPLQPSNRTGHRKFWTFLLLETCDHLLTWRIKKQKTFKERQLLKVLKLVHSHFEPTTWSSVCCWHGHSYLRQVSLPNYEHFFPACSTP